MSDLIVEAEEQSPEHGFGNAAEAELDDPLAPIQLFESEKNDETPYKASPFFESPSSPNLHT